jgi:DNA-directed RNA polymerase subunit RPC12/RpoP
VPADSPGECQSGLPNPVLMVTVHVLVNGEQRWMTMPKARYDAMVAAVAPSAPPEMEPPPPPARPRPKLDYVCAVCGNEQSTPDSPLGDGRNCQWCSSPRVVPISFAEEMFGPDWREAFK